MGIYSIAFIPKGTNRAQFEALKEQITTLCKGKKKAIPVHISIRETFETEKVDKLIHELTQICKKFTPFRMTPKKVQRLGPNTIALVFIKTKKLQRFHEIILKLVDKYRTDYIQPKYLKNLQQLPKKQKGYVQQHGYPYCLEYYLPHLTLAYEAKPSMIKKNEKKLKNMGIKKSFIVSEVAVLVKKGGKWEVKKFLKLKASK